MNYLKSTQIIGVSPEEFKNIILEDVRKELNDIQLQSKTADPEEYYTRKELAKVLKVTLPTISDWTKKGLLKAYRLGKLVRYKKSEVDEALKKI